MRFAGHPTLGAAFVLGAPLQRGVIELETLAGIVPVALERDESGALVFGRMMQPVPRVEAVEDPDGVLAAIGAERSALPIELYDNGARHILVMLDDASELGRLTRDGDAIAALEITGVNAFARSERRLAQPDVLGRTGRIPQRGRPQARSPATSRATASSPGARRS